MNAINYKNNKGFTLIELLVVISIIGMMSSVVLASVNVTRDKARLAGAQKFSGYNNRTLSADAAGIWSFDEGSGSIAYDTSGNSNNVTLSAGATRSSAETPNKVGYSLSLSAGTYAGAPYSQSLDISKGTLSTWVKTSNQAIQAIIVKVGSYSLYTRVGQAVLYDANSNTYKGSNTTVSDDKWHRAAVSFNHNVANGLNIYVDGLLKYTGTASTPSGGLNGVGIGSAFYNSAATTFTGYIDDVVIYNSVLAQDKINEIYAKGLTSHSNLSINK